MYNIYMSKKTKLYGIFSESPQMGKTTTHINLLKSTYADWHVFTSIYDRNVVAEDYKSKCIQAGINMQQLSADTNIKTILKERWNRGMIDQVYRYFALGNLKGIQNLLDVAYGLKEYGIPRLLSIDEADIYGDFLELFPVDNEGKPKRDTRMREIMAEGTFDHIQAITASWEDFLHSAYEFDPELNIYIQNDDFYGPLNTDWVVRDYWDGVDDWLKDNIKAPPREFINDLEKYGGMVNITTKNILQEKLAKIIEVSNETSRLYGSFNEVQNSYLKVAGHKASRSATFGMDTLFYWRKNLTNSKTSDQALGRVYNYNQKPTIITSEEIMNDEIEYAKKKRHLLDIKAFNLPLEERYKEAENVDWDNPATKVAPKLKANRRIESTREHKKGDESKLITEYYSYTPLAEDKPQIDEVFEEGVKYGRLLITLIKKFNPELHAEILKGTYKTIMFKNDERHKFIKGKRSQDFRICYYNEKIVCIKHNGDYYENCSWHDIDGEVITTAKTIKGKIKRK